MNSLRLERRAVVLLAIVWLGFGLIVDGFVSDATFTSILGRSVDNGLIAVGFTACLLAGQIDLSVGSLYALAGVTFASMEPDLGVFGGFAVAVAVGLGVGLINGTLIGYFRLDSFTATLGTLLLCRGLAFAWSGGQPVNGKDLQASLWFNRSLLGPISPRVVVLVAFALLVHVVVVRTRLGRELVAVGGDIDAARAAGIPVARRVVVACVISSLGASLAGAVAALSLLSGSPIVGESNLLIVIAAVFLGGAALTGGSGSTLASAIAVLVVASIATGMELAFIDKAWQGVVTGIVIIVGSLTSQRRRLGALLDKVRARFQSNTSTIGSVET
jgi:ribose transport system permease protein